MQRICRKVSVINADEIFMVDDFVLGDCLFEKCKSKDKHVYIYISTQL